MLDYQGTQLSSVKTQYQLAYVKPSTFMYVLSVAGFGREMSLKAEKEG